MNKNLLFKIATGMVLGGTLALTYTALHAVNQWSKTERDLEKAEEAIIAEGALIVALMDRNEKLNKELNELKAKRK